MTRIHSLQRRGLDRPPGVRPAAVRPDVLPRRRRRAGRAAGALCLAAALAGACGDGRDGPLSRPTPLRVLTLEGPAAVSLGGSGRYRATRRDLTAATVADVTDRAEWISSNPAVLSIDRGVATPHAAGNTSLQARFEGLQTAQVPVQVVLDHSGTYTLTIGGGPCAGAGGLSAALATRTYTAQVTHSATAPATLVVMLSGPKFEPGSDRFSGEIRADGVRFVLHGSWDVWGSVTEVLPDGSWLEIAGETLAAPAPSGFSGTFRGAFLRWTDDSVRGWEVVGSCQSTAHQFTMTR